MELNVLSTIKTMVTDLFLFSRGWGKKECARVPCLAKGRDTTGHMTTHSTVFQLVHLFKRLFWIHVVNY
jgi:hypothetical protein